MLQCYVRLSSVTYALWLTVDLTEKKLSEEAYRKLPIYNRMVM